MATRTKPERDRFTFDLPKELADLLRAEAERRDWTLTQVAKEALRTYLTNGCRPAA